MVNRQMGKRLALDNQNQIAVKIRVYPSYRGIFLCFSNVIRRQYMKKRPNLSSLPALQKTFRSSSLSISDPKC